MKTRLLIIIGIVSIIVSGVFSISYGEFEKVPYGSCHLNLQWEYSDWFGIPDYLNQLQRCISNIPFTVQSVFAQSLEDPECGPHTFLNDMKICEEILAESGDIDMRGEWDKIISKVLILSVPVIVIAVGYYIWRIRK